MFVNEIISWINSVTTFYTSSNEFNQFYSVNNLSFTACLCADPRGPCTVRSTEWTWSGTRTLPTRWSTAPTRSMVGATDVRSFLKGHIWSTQGLWIVRDHFEGCSQDSFYCYADGFPHPHLSNFLSSNKSLNVVMSQLIWIKDFAHFRQLWDG